MLEEMLPRMQNYLRGLILDEGLPGLIGNCWWLPAEWGSIEDRDFLAFLILGNYRPVTQTIFDGAQISAP